MTMHSKIHWNGNSYFKFRFETFLISRQLAYLETSKTLTNPDILVILLLVGLGAVSHVTQRAKRIRLSKNCSIISAAGGFQEFLLNVWQYILITKNISPSIISLNPPYNTFLKIVHEIWFHGTVAFQYSFERIVVDIGVSNSHKVQVCRVW